MIPASKPYTPSARIWNALSLADLLDAAHITSITTLSAMECWRGPRGTRNMRRNLSK